MSSPVASLQDAIVSQVSAGSEISALVGPEKRERLVRGLTELFYEDQPEPVIFDTNRAWTAKIDAIARLFPDARLICTVRDVNWVLDSLERQYRGNSFENTRLFDSQGERATVYSRTETLASSNRLVGFAYHALREACWSDHADRLVIVDYELLVSHPKRVIDLIYDFIGEPHFEHDFENLDYDAPAFDQQIGLSGLHKVRKRVAPDRRKTILPPDLFERYAGMAFWNDLGDSRSFRIVQTSEDTS